VRTRELIDVLAADARPVPRGELERALILTGLAGAIIALVLVVVWLKLRPDLAAAVGGGFFWIKAAYTAALGGLGFWSTERLSRPGASARSPALAAIAVLAAFALAAALQMGALSPPERINALRGLSWTVCTRNIAILAAPMIVIALVVMRRLAPTEPASAGFAAGAFAGGTAATVYGLHCPEATYVFVCVWYTLAIAISALVGAGIGRFMLRW
jgi:hypothetical protein